MLTIRDIARQAGVSVSTASRALNDNPRISAATRERIKRIADRAGYRPNYNAKNLTAGEANAVGVIFPTAEQSTTENPFYIDLMRGVNERLQAQHYVLSVAIGRTTDDLLANVQSMVTQGKIKRFILMYSHEGDPIADYLRQQQLRFVLIGQPEPGQTDLHVDNDNVAAGVGAAQFLIDQLQVRHPVFVETTHDWRYEAQRRSGYEQVMQDAKLPSLICRLTDMATVTQFVTTHPEIDGILATDDMNAIEFYRQFRDQYPEKPVAVVSFNRSLPSTMALPTFHSVDLFPEKMGAAAVDLLFDEQTAPSTPSRSVSVAFAIH